MSNQRDPDVIAIMVAMTKLAALVEHERKATIENRTADGHSAPIDPRAVGYVQGLEKALQIMTGRE